MLFTLRETDKLLVYTLALVAQRRKDQGLKLNHPETVSLISVAALEGARAGRTVEEVMELAGKTITRADVMEGVAEMIPFVQIEALFTDGSRLVTVHNPVK